MARLIYALNQSLDGYVDHDGFDPPNDVLFRHFIEHARGLAGSLYGRRMYETMRYWDQTDQDWDEDRSAFAEAWRAQPKHVVSRTLTSVGPNATLITGVLEDEVWRLKRDVAGEVEVAGPELADGLTRLGLIDEYHIYLHAAVVGGGKPFFAGPRPPLRLVAHEEIGNALRLIYVPAA